MPARSITPRLRSAVMHRTLAVVALMFFAAVPSGCGGGANVAGIKIELPTEIGFLEWDSLTATSCRGWLGNVGLSTSNAQVELWYATAQGETLRVVSVGEVPASTGAGFGMVSFRATPQLTGGEPRFPRVGVVSWNGGSSRGQPRNPDLRFNGNWCWTSPDSLQGSIENRGGWAYHVVMTIEDGAGVHEIAQPLGRLRGQGAIWAFKAAARESLGILLPPKLLKFRWEDYGGIADSIVSPPADTASSRCY